MRVAYDVTLPDRLCPDAYTRHRNVLDVGGMLARACPAALLNWQADGPTLHCWWDTASDADATARIDAFLTSLAGATGVTFTPAPPPTDGQVAAHHATFSTRWATPDEVDAVMQDALGQEYAARGAGRIPPSPAAPLGFDWGNDDHVRWHMYGRAKGEPFPGDQAARPPGKATVVSVTEPTPALPAGGGETVGAVENEEDR